MTVNFNNCRCRDHASLYKTGAFFDLNTTGLQAAMKLQFLMIARRLLITTLVASSLCSESVSAQERLFATNAAWNAAYEAMCPKDGNELASFYPESSLQSILDAALADTAFVRDQPPLVRAICQRMAWRAFDSLAADSDYVDSTNQALRLRLARIIGVSALTSDEIARLPNTYTSTAIGDNVKRNPVFDIELPIDLFDKDGSWLQLTHKRLGRIGLTHERSRKGRSEFLLFVRFLNLITLSRLWVVQSVPYGKRPKSLPTVLGQEVSAV